MSQPEPSPLCALISSTAYPMSSDSCVLQSHNRVAVTELTNAPNIVNQMDLMNSLNQHVVVPLPAIQAVANVQIPASQAGTMLPDTRSSSAILGLLMFADLWHDYVFDFV